MSSPEGSTVSFHRVPAGLSRDAIERFARKLEAGIAAGNTFHCRITTDSELRRLNREFRGEDRATDVLSFPALRTRQRNSENGLFVTRRSLALTRNGADAPIGFVSSPKIASVRSSLLKRGIRNLPEIGFVPSNRAPVSAAPQIGFVSASRNRRDDRPAGESNKRRTKGRIFHELTWLPVGPAPRLYLGDIAISLPRAQAQARAFGHAVEQECGILMLHGLLHLLGMDHETDGGLMAQTEQRWRARLGLPVGLIERAEL